MVKGILGIKLGMTSVYEGDKLVAVTVLKAGPCMVTNKMTKEKNGYNAVQLGFIEVKPEKLNKPEAGVFKAKKLSMFRYLKEFRNMDGEIGDNVTVEIFKDSRFVNVSGISKGKGFSGVVKRWGFGGWPKTHGSGGLRRPGSIGAGTTPGKVFKGHPMAGHLGVNQTTVQKLRVVKIIPEKDLILVKGNVPGPDKNFIVVKAGG